MTDTSTLTAGENATPVLGRIDGAIRWGGHGIANPRKFWVRLPEGETLTFPQAQTLDVAVLDRGHRTARRVDLRAGATITGPIFYRRRDRAGSLRARAHAPIVLAILTLATVALTWLGISTLNWISAERWTKPQMFVLFYGVTLVPILGLLWMVFLRHVLIVAPALKRNGRLEFETPATIEIPQAI